MSNNVPRVSLDERITKLKESRMDFSDIFELRLIDYFYGLSMASCDEYFIGSLEELTKNNVCDEMNDISQQVHCLNGMTEQNKEKFLYCALIEPFCCIQSLESEEKADEYL